MVARIKGTVDAYELGKTGAYAIIPEPPYYPGRVRPETQERAQRILATLSGKAPSRGPAPTTVPGLLKGRVELPSTERAQQAPSKLPTFTVSAEDVSKMRPMTSPARIVKNIINPAQLRQLVRDGAARSASEINNATILAYQKATERGLEHKQARETVQGIVDAFRKSDLKITEENVAKYFDNIDAGFGLEEAV